MTKLQKNLVRVLVLVLVASMVLPMVACRRNNEEDPTAPQTGTVTYTVEVKSAGGMALPGVGVYVYEDETQAELVWFDQTGEDGRMTFTDVPRDTYVAVLSEVPTGYAVEEFYPITGELTQIVLAAGQLDPDNVGDLTYKLGDMMMDFTVVGPDGTEYTLSELLQQKKAVVLNFWYIECGPCKAEFPFLQEAYEKYSDDIAVIAMNPLNTSEDIAAFQQENGYTFPMVSCGPEWEKLMGITAYPTTVVIDRFGNICLIHKGTIDNAKTFEDTFAYFASDDYEQKLIQDIAELEMESEEGTAENPTDATGKSSFEIVVEPGKEVFTELYKANGMYLTIKGEGQDYYVLYNDKKLTPDSSGKVGFVITTGDNYTPSVFGIGNTGSETQKFSATLSFLPGTFNNPYSMKLGEFTAKVNAGNDQGVNYVYYAQESGTLTLQCLSATAGIEYGYTLYNTMTMAVRSLEDDGSKGEDGIPTLSVVCNKGDKVLLTVSTLPDDSHNYPAGTFKFLASFEAGEGTTVEKIERIDYTVTVTDEADQPLKDISVWLTKDAETLSAKTDENGVVTMNLEKGTYTGSVSVPEGYTLENNAFELTEEAPSVTVKLTAAVDTRVDYTVKAVDPEGAPVEGVEVMVIGGESGLTDATGTVTFLMEPGSYTVLIATMPAGYECGDMLSLTADVLTGTFQLAYAPGTQGNPIMLQNTENSVTNAGTVYYGAQFSGATMSITGPAGFQVLLDGQTLTEQDGEILCPITAADPRSPVVFAIVGDGQFQVNFTYPVGHQMNPAQLVLGQNKATQAAGASDYYYNWTAEADCQLTIAMDAAAQWVYSVSNLTTGVASDTCWSDDETPTVSQTLTVKAGETIQVIVNTYDPANPFQSPAGDVTVTASAVWIIDEVPFTTAAIEPGTNLSYLVAGTDGGTLTIEDADAYVIYGNTTYGPDSTGKVTVAMGAETTAALTIGNSGTEIKNFDVTFTWPKGSLRNPEPIKRFPVTTRLSSGDEDGYYYLYTPTQPGTLTLTKQSSSPATSDYTITIDRNSGEQTMVSGEYDTTKTVKLYVVPDDQILVHVQAVEKSGSYPAITVVTKGSFVVDYSTYTVTFNANGGTLTGAASATTTKGKLAQMPTDPVRTGHEFTGWYDAAEGGNPITTATVIKSNLTAYAQWNKVEYTVTFNANGGTLEGETSVVTTDYKLSVLPEPTLSGYIFQGWFDLPVGGNQVTTDTVYTAHTELYAQWQSDGTGGSTGETINYQVTVVDDQGTPVPGGVYVTWQGASATQIKAISDATGTVSVALPADTYNILLNLTGDYKTYRYDAQSAVATAEKPAVTVQIAAPISDTVTETEFSAGSGDIVTKDIELGATYVKLGSSQSNYTVIDGKSYCFFRFLITEEGKYAFTTSNGAPITNWGTNTYFIEDRTSAQEREANAFVVAAKEANFAADSHVLQLIFAVEVTDGYTDTIILAEDAGEVEWSIDDEPYIAYEGEQTPAVEQVDGKPVAIEENVFKLTTGGKTLTYVDMLNDKYVKGDDGFYHLNTKDGPVLYINLGENAPYISMGILTGAIGQYGTGFRKTFTNPDGTYELNPDGTYRKEDYTDAIVAYCLHVDPTTGVYPLNDDLIYMIQQGGEFLKWYDPESDTYLFKEQDIQVDLSLAWMFAVCYLK